MPGRGNALTRKDGWLRTFSETRIHNCLKSHPMLRLFTTFYLETDPLRRREYEECLRRNLACMAIDEICLLLEGDGVQLPESPKLRVSKIPVRPTYDDFIRWINEVAMPDDISVVANTDIWFDGSIGVVTPRMGIRECYALARWDGERLNDRNDSQDCWVFRGKVEGVRGDFPLGVVRCDNRILYELQQAGYRVLNPAFAIRTTHLHAGVRGEYADTEDHFIQPPYRYLWPHNLLGPLGTCWHNLRFPHQKLGWHFDRRKAARTLPVRVIRKLAQLAMCSTKG